MSRIGKKPIAIPKGVTVKVDGNAVDVKGPKGADASAAAAGRQRRRSRTASS